jgi:hypothetical protein
MPSNIRPFFKPNYILRMEDLMNIKDKVAQVFLEQFHREFDMMVLDYARGLNLHMTDRYGDTFNGDMQFASPGTFSIPVVPTDPTTLREGQLWENSTTHLLKTVLGGTVTVVAPVTGTGGGIPEAPTDGQTYGRKSSGWVVIISFPEAPTDGQIYGRKSSAWAVVPAGGGGATVTMSDTPPPSPVNGQLWFDTAGTQFYIWYADPTSSQWINTTNAPTGAVATVSDTAPASPVNGMLWWDSTVGQMFMYYSDPTSSQWVAISPPPGH